MKKDKLIKGPGWGFRADFDVDAALHADHTLTGWTKSKLINEALRLALHPRYKIVKQSALCSAQYRRRRANLPSADEPSTNSSNEATSPASTSRRVRLEFGNRTSRNSSTNGQAKNSANHQKEGAKK